MGRWEDVFQTQLKPPSALVHSLAERSSLAELTYEIVGPKCIIGGS